MRNSILPIAALLSLFILSCASMDLRLDTLRSDPNYGKMPPHILWEEFEYFTGEPERPYKELAKLIVQETPTVVLARSAEEMITHMCKEAWKKGADAVINVEITTTNVAGAARVTPVVKGTAIRFTD